MVKAPRASGTQHFLAEKNDTYPGLGPLLGKALEVSPENHGAVSTQCPKT